MRVALSLYFSLVFLCSQPTYVSAERFHISVYNDGQVSAFTFSVFKGTYQLFADSTYLFDVNSNNVLYLSYAQGKINLYDVNGLLGVFMSVACYGIEDDNRFKIQPLQPDLDHRVYDNDLFVKPSFGSLLMINQVFEANYLAGVVETESGVNRHLEFYKAQASLARTYAYKNKDRHQGEGFHLCDGVHCQAYKRRSNEQNILQATRETEGVVVTYDSALISAFYHANCGGQTQNSDQVWFVSEPYLKSVNDPFCLRSRGARWEKTIARKAWEEYLRRNLISTSSLPQSQLEFTQTQRQSHYHNTGIPLTKIRQDWQLRSTFFSAAPAASEQIVLRGRGYGHGVGLCQEGAMEMANQGFDYIGILNYYFNDIRLLPFHQLPQHK